MKRLTLLGKHVLHWWPFYGLGCLWAAAIIMSLLGRVGK